MVNKKKYLNILYMFSLVVLFVTFLGLYSNSYAMTINELSTYIDDFNSKITSNNLGYSTWIEFYNNDKNTYLNNIELGFSSHNLNFADVTTVRIRANNEINFSYVLGDKYLRYDSISNPKALYSANPLTGGMTDVSYNTGTNATWLNTGAFYLISTYTYGTCGIYPMQNIYTDFPPITTISLENLSTSLGMTIYSTPFNQKSINLISTSNHKFGFDDKNQCQAFLTGYDIHDITFYIDRYINDEWEQFTDSSDYYRLSDSDEPYYIFWSNINYFPVGTYRYRAVYDYDNQYTSDSFSITNMIIDNEGTYDNGFINIDTGNTVDNIKDYFGGQVDTTIGNISGDDLESSLNMQSTVNPYENFVFTIVNGLLDSLVGTSPEYISFKVHSWGQTFKIYVEDIVPNYGTDLRNFLTTISTVVVVLYIIRWITMVVESINVADVDTTLDLIEEKYSDLL